MPDIPAHFEDFLLDGNPQLAIHPDSFHRFTYMKFLKLPESSVPYSDQKLLQNKTNLLEIQFPNQKITEISPELFTNTNRLEVVEGLVVSDLPSRIFYPLTNLRDLHLRTYQSDIPEETFSHNVALRDLVLQANNMNTIPDGLFSQNPQLKSVMLEIDSVLGISKSVFINSTGLNWLALSGRQLSLGCSVLPAAYKLSSRVSDVNELDACTFSRVEYPGSIVLSRIEHLTCSDEIQMSNQIVNELSVTESHLTELAGKRLLVLSTRGIIVLIQVLCTT